MSNALTHTCRGIAGLLVLFVSLTAAAAQRTPATTTTPETPARDAMGAPTSGTGVIAGRVLHNDTERRPVRRAMVALGSGSVGGRMAVTDDQGRFAFTGLPAGRYTIRLSKASYIAIQYGARNARSQALPIALADGQRITDVVATIARGAVVTGRVVDQNNVPIANARITTVERIVINGSPTFRASLAGSIATDDRGVYRFYGFERGTWLVSVAVSGPMAAAAARVATPEELRWAERRASLSPSAPPPTPPAARPVKYSSVYYPGVTDPMLATALTFENGEEKSGIDIVVPIVPTATIAGRVIQSDGSGLGPAQMALQPVGQSMPGNFGRRVVIGPTGDFTIEGVEPGRYTLVARAVGSALPGAAPSGRGGVPVAPNLYATADVAIAGEDVTGLGMMLEPILPASGRVAFERGTDAPPANPVGTSVSLRPAVPGLNFGGGFAAASPDGSFTVWGLTPGSYAVAGIAADPTWVLKAATSGGRDILDAPLEVRAGVPIPEMTLIFTDRKTELSGSIIDQAGRPMADYSVIVFGTNPAFWNQGSRWLRMPVRPSTDGRFAIAGLPPGDYYLAALSAFDPQEWYTPAFLEQVVPGAIKISLAEGEKRVQDLRLQ